jgi:hypothetical protein
MSKRFYKLFEYCGGEPGKVEMFGGIFTGNQTRNRTLGHNLLACGFGTGIASNSAFV